MNRKQELSQQAREISLRLAVARFLLCNVHTVLEALVSLMTELDRMKMGQFLHLLAGDCSYLLYF